MQLKRLPHAVTLQGPLGNAGTCNLNDSSDAESPPCNSDRDICTNQRKGSPIVSGWHTDHDGDPVTPIKRPSNEFALDNDNDASEEWILEKTAVIKDPQPKHLPQRVLAGQTGVWLVRSFPENCEPYYIIEFKHYKFKII
jgi:hypothetical protein